MRSKARCLLDKAVDAMVAAIEVYNKPMFSHREETFSILAVNAWELLLKARLLQINANQLAAILEYERRKRADGTPSQMLYRKKNRAGNCVTLGLFKACDRLASDGDPVPAPVRKNLEALVEIRDNAVHFLNDDLQMTKGVHEIGSATVKNFLAAVRQWFGVDLSRYSFALMPLAFLAAPHTVEGINLNSEERHLLKYLAAVRDDVPEGDASEDFSVALTIEVMVKRTKDPQATAILTSNAEGALPVKLDEEDIREKYPWTYEILTTRLQKRYSNFKANQKYHALRKPLEGDARFCRERLLDPAKPDGLSKRFYNPNIQKEFDAHYERAKPDLASASAPDAGEGSAA